MPRHIRTTEKLSEMRDSVDDEDTYQEWLKDGLNSAGWTAVREVEPRGSRHRADLICKTEVGGETVTLGIETKGFGSGTSITGEAAEQIFDRYHCQRFAVFGEVDLWAVATARNYSRDYRSGPTRAAVCKRVLNGLGLGWIEERGDRVVVIFAATAGPAFKLPLFNYGHKDTPSPADASFDSFDLERCRRVARTDPF